MPDWEAFHAGCRRPGYVPGFDITRRLGSGAFGLVFKATQQSSGRDFAIKFLRVDDGEVRTAVLRELQRLQQFPELDHPHLVAIEDYGEVDGILYLVMDHAGARTLRDLLPLPTDRSDGVLALFAQVCRGVAALHERDFVHFDLKPQNVFLKSGVARVADHGLSRLITHSQATLAMARAAPGYMAPELLRRQGDARSDIYSLGVMLGELLTGRLPFAGWPPEVGPRERAIVERCIAPDPKQRFQGVHDLLAVLHGRGPIAATAAAAAPSQPPTAPPPPPPVREPRRRAVRIGPIAMVVAFTAAFGAYLAARMTATVRAATVRRHVEDLPEGPLLPQRERPAADDARSEIRRLAGSIERAARRRSTRTRLQALDVPLPPDLPLYSEEVARLVDARVVSPMLQAQLEQYGHSFVLAAVAWLQERDYADARDCAAATRVLACLQAATAVSGIVVDAPLAEPDATTTRRFLAAADAWRCLVERFAADPGAYRRLLVATGKIVEAEKH